MNPVMNPIKILFPVTLMLLLAACSTDETTTVEPESKATVSELIELTKAQFDLGEMEIGGFSQHTFKRVIKSTGSLDVPPENKSTVSAYFGGYVKTISLLQGQKVRKGEVLFTLENPEYIQVQEDFLEAKSLLSYLKADFERQKSLSTDNVSSRKTFEKAESDYRITFARYESLKRKLQLMNIEPAKITETNLRTTIAVTAPISGFVTSVLATKGMFLNPSDVALTIISTDHMHIELSIFEQDLSTVKIGQEVAFRLQNSPTIFSASVYLINKAIDPDKRSIKVHCHLKNETDAQQFTPGMYVEADIFTSSEKSESLPVSAVVSIENRQFVLVKKRSTKNGYLFEQKEVKVGQTVDDFVHILNAHEFDQNVEFLTNGSFNLIKE